MTDASHQVDTIRDTSVNPLDPNCKACNGPLNTDARHRVTLSGVYRAPLGFTVSGILRYHSGLPYTVYAYDAAGKTKLDLNGDGYAQDLAPGHNHVNDARGPSFSQLDLRLGKQFNFTGKTGVELILEAFNVTNSKNATSFDSFGKTHAFAGDPGQGEQRLVQLGARIHF